MTDVLTLDDGQLALIDAALAALEFYEDGRSDQVSLKASVKEAQAALADLPRNGIDPADTHPGYDPASANAGDGSNVGSSHTQPGNLADGDGTFHSAKKPRWDARKRMARTAARERTEIRLEKDGTRWATARGYASMTELDYDVRDAEGEFSERVRRGAFAGVLKGDTVLQYDHAGLVLARTTAGSLQLEEDERGLRYTARLDREQRVANDLVLAIESGAVRSSSFGFTTALDQWSPSWDSREIIRIGRLYDVSCVGFPASKWTTGELTVVDDDRLRAMRSRQAAAELEALRVAYPEIERR